MSSLSPFPFSPILSIFIIYYLLLAILCITFVFYFTQLTMLKYLDYKELSEPSNERMNFLLEKISRSDCFYKALLPNEDTYKYFTKEQLDFILGKDKKAIISNLINDGIIERIEKRDSHGNMSNMFSLKKRLASKKYKPRDKRFLKSVDNYYKSVMIKQSSKARMIASHLRKFKIEISRVEFIEWVFLDIKSKDKLKTTLDEAYGDRMLIWDYIQQFNNSKGNQIIDLIVEDTFSGRIHTPLTTLPTGLRKYIKHRDGSSVTSIDLVSSQPNILAHILNEEDLNNEFSKAFFESDDIYVDLKDKLSLKSRKEAKSTFFKCVFGDGSSNEALLFGSMYPRSAQMLWQMRLMVIDENPSIKQHSNIAWLLQKKETEIFSEIWDKLNSMSIDFFTVHDQVFFKEKDLDRVLFFSNQITSKFLKKFKFESK